ncbi:MAG: 3-alpha-(or 20-beta)-hydroxysteroid dehydrogenase [Bradyrhizobium sp.]|nr:3-alpha-(or 20-beta)-hydroxysteroid dehydrogenase [Bradyrhizobium sp.]
MARLNERICLVTGAAGGIGREIARLFAAEGGVVVMTDVVEGLGEAVARQIGAQFLCQDVTDRGRWHQIVEEIAQRHGRLDVLVNNAGWEGPIQEGSLKDVSLEAWRRVQAINVEGTWSGCQVAIPIMRDTGGGSIVNLASIAALYGTPDIAAYGVSKAPVKQLTLSMPMVGAPLGIRCNAIVPGLVDTRMLRDLQAGRARRGALTVAEATKADSNVPLGRVGTPLDIAYGALFLASNISNYVTGTTLVIDGGLSAKL